ncbi:UGMP family protein [Candidatus Pacearchaeota archaeon CG10_big_fil_rev_8_21_14_0_10_35_13]|nr:MAG: UGMP family protein [Candidatus Pacearchaeota archaeon CG10_big_fil_rev_8_21_14_0_10_35_13]
MVKKYVLGVETTAHTFGIGIVELSGVLNNSESSIIVNIKESFTTDSGGLIPIVVAKHHKAVSQKVYDNALNDAKISEGEIVAVAVSNAPGLSPCLLEGLRFSKSLANRLKIPLIPVNHCIAHLEIGRITGAKDPVLLYASGANTQVITYAGGKFRVFGETLDVGIGNFIDTFARYVGIGFPGGPVIDKLAQGVVEEDFVELPYSVKGMDMAFSGLLTNLKQKYDSKKFKLDNLAYSLQETAFAMLVEASERALAHTGKSELLLGGGVSCNKRLQEMCRKMCDDRGAKLFLLPNSLLVDNGGMIAFLGAIIYDSIINNKKKFLDIKNIDISPRERTDDVEVFWR